MSAERDLHTRHVDALESIARSLAALADSTNAVCWFVLVVCLFGVGWCT